jgi:mono/diheme cytochrome c family protein
MRGGRDSNRQRQSDGDAMSYRTMSIGGGVAVALAAAVAIVLLVARGPLPFQQERAPGATDAFLSGGLDAERTLLERYCIDCHNDLERAGGAAFDRASLAHPLENAQLWESTIRKIRTGMMPPADRPRPAREILDAWAWQLGARIDAEWAHRPAPGSEGASRLNRAEYANAIRDLLAFDASHIVNLLPADVSMGGFDNVADALSVSPTLIEGYVSAAMRIGREAVGDRTMGPTQVRYEAPSGPQVRHVDGLPLGTRGGLLIEHNFPLDAEYDIRIAAQGVGGVFTQRFCDFPEITVTLGGDALDLEPSTSFRLSVLAGPRTIGVALIDRQRCEGVNELYGWFAASGAIQAVEIHGPYDPVGPGDTPSRRAIFVCHPAEGDMEEPCAREILTNLATRAFRRPVGASDAEIDTLMAFYRHGEAEGGFESGIQHALSRLLIDPRFLFRLENEPQHLTDGDVYAVSELELASRLSFFLWSSLPDTELVTLAAQGRLREPGVLEQQVRRMLADARAQSLVENFAGQWLKLRELDEALPQDPAFDTALRDAFRLETELLFADLMREGRSVLHLLDAEYTYLNEVSAAHYGIAGVRGSYMRRVALPADSPRRGILGHGSVLTATSVANRTSPVIRGEWIVENVLGLPAPVPPPGVEADLSDETVPEGRVARTLRERLELHLEDSACASCHQIIDPYGFALENFDLVGRWRETENGHPIDTSTALVDGTSIHGPVDLRRALLDRSDSFVTSMTERLLTYALGRVVEHYDMPAVRKIVRDAAREDYRFPAIVFGIVESLPFQMKVKGPAQAAERPLTAQAPDTARPLDTED